MVPPADNPYPLSLWVPDGQQLLHIIYIHNFWPLLLPCTFISEVNPENWRDERTQLQHGSRHNNFRARHIFCLHTDVTQSFLPATAPPAPPQPNENGTMDAELVVGLQ